MPKTTKTTRKASPASNKKTGLKRRFDLTNKKVQFFVVIGIVAILGGGYFTVKSFANTVVYAQGPQNLLALTNQCNYNRNGNDTTKNIANTLDVSCSSGSSAGFNSRIEPKLIGFHDTCVTAKGSGKIKITMTNGGKFEDPNMTRSLEHTMNNDGQYHTYCSGALYSYGNDTVRSGFVIKGPALVKVTQLQVIKVSNQTSTPTVGK